MFIRIKQCGWIILCQPKDQGTILRKVIELVDIGVSNLWGYFKDVVLMACDEVCGKKRSRRSKGDRWWLNEEVKKAMS